MEGLNVVAEHRSQRQGSKALHECREACRDNGKSFPFGGPIQRIMDIRCWLRNQDSTVLARTLDEMMRAHISHHLSAWDEFDMEFLRDLMESLHATTYQSSSGYRRRTKV